MARDQRAIQDQLSEATTQSHLGSRWPALSYEEGVVAALSWLMGLTDDKPMDEGAHV